MINSKYCLVALSSLWTLSTKQIVKKILDTVLHSEQTQNFTMNLKSSNVVHWTTSWEFPKLCPLQKILRRFLSDLELFHEHLLMTLPVVFLNLLLFLELKIVIYRLRCQVAADSNFAVFKGVDLSWVLQKCTILDMF